MHNVIRGIVIAAAVLAGLVVGPANTASADFRPNSNCVGGSLGTPILQVRSLSPAAALFDVRVSGCNFGGHYHIYGIDGAGLDVNSPDVYNWTSGQWTSRYQGYGLGWVCVDPWEWIGYWHYLGVSSCVKTY